MTLRKKNIRHQYRIGPILLMALLLWPLPGLAYLDLSRAHVSQLNNGLTLIVLEEHALPVVSVQMLYRVGARNETAGATGLAHFLEHMAFRDSENFPGTDLVSAIYAVGGEWHGYTWLDQTTYYSTVPRDELDLLLRIEADRMARLQISEEDVLVERGAVLTEMHSYENDPMSVLHDQAMYLTFLAHPYRNNTIGWESDVAQMSYADVLAFYQQHYHPGNAILAVVGNVTSDQVNALVQRYFSEIPGQPATPPPHTLEPPQNGERRIRMQGELEQKYFKIVYRAPAASSPDYAPFLVLQELLGGGSGVSFLQNDWGTPARAASPLGEVPGSLTTWFPPSAQEYVFVISGIEAPDADEPAIESAVTTAIGLLRQRLMGSGERAQAALLKAQKNVVRELIFDVQTTEDAAHQLTFFAGLDALNTLLELPRLVQTVTVADVLRVMDHYLRPEQQIIAWYVPAGTATTGFAEAGAQTATPVPKEKTRKPWQGWEDTRDASGDAATGESGASPPPLSQEDWVFSMSGSAAPKGQMSEGISPPMVRQLSNGIPVILQRSPLSPTASLRVITPLAEFPAGALAYPNQPVWGYTTLAKDVLAPELPAALSRASQWLKSASPPDGRNAVDTSSPESMLNHSVDSLLGLQAATGDAPASPLLITVSGDIDQMKVLSSLEALFGEMQAAPYLTPGPLDALEPREVELTLDTAAAQVQLGYIVQAPPPSDPDSAAWQMTLYILTHHYEGRLGKEAISNRGLIYYIDSAYHTDGTNGWITLGIGVDPKNQAAMKALLQEQLAGLRNKPPTQAEVDEARNHLLGRLTSAAQSNPELADQLARQWLWYGPMADYQSNNTLQDDLAHTGEAPGLGISPTPLEQRLISTNRQDILNTLPAFTNGSIITIINPPPRPNPSGQGD